MLLSFIEDNLELYLTDDSNGKYAQTIENILYAKVIEEKGASSCDLVRI